MGLAINSTTAIVAAGGRAQRMAVHGPKSLITVNLLPLLLHTLNSIQACGINHVLVCVDGEQEVGRIQRLCQHRRGVEVICSRGVDSTLVVCREAAAGRARERIVFFYGHAPRPARIVREIAGSRAEMGGLGLIRSSRRVPIPIPPKGFLEPPFCLLRSSLDVSIDSWGEFFKSLEHVDVHWHEGPPEFNTPEEFEVYRRYLLRRGARRDSRGTRPHSVSSLASA